MLSSTYAYFCVEFAYIPPNPYTVMISIFVSRVNRKKGRGNRERKKKRIGTKEQKNRVKRKKEIVERKWKKEIVKKEIGTNK